MNSSQPAFHMPPEVDPPKYGCVPEKETQRHVATAAWRALRSDATVERIEILSRKKKSAVYRLVAAGPGGRAVIGKRSLRSAASVERAVYEHVLPGSEVAALAYFGAIDESDSEFSWIFVEDAVGWHYAVDGVADRQLAAEWLARLHLSTSRTAGVPRLPDRSPAYYRELLGWTQSAIERNVENRALRTDHREVLREVLSQCRVIESRWDKIVADCRHAPATLTHGDLSVKNVRTCARDGSSVLVPFDWETAGWGLPYADLAQVDIPPTGSSLCASLDVYWNCVRHSWPHVALEDVRRWAYVGVVFRLISVMSWASWSLGLDRAGKAVGGYRMYVPVMDEAIEELSLGAAR